MLDTTLALPARYAAEYSHILSLHGIKFKQESRIKDNGSVVVDYSLTATLEQTQTVAKIAEEIEKYSSVSYHTSKTVDQVMPIALQNRVKVVKISKAIAIGPKTLIYRVEVEGKEGNLCNFHKMLKQRQN